MARRGRAGPFRTAVRAPLPHALDPNATGTAGVVVATVVAQFAAGTDGDHAYHRPDADVADGGWVTTPLWSKLDEVVPDDTDYISWTGGGTSTVAKIGLT